MAAKKESKLLASDLIGKWRIRSKSGAGYIGTVTAIYDNALIMEMVNKETVIIFMDSIESMYEGLLPPKLEEQIEAKV